MNMREIIDSISYRLDEMPIPYLFHGTQLKNALGIIKDNKINGYTERDYLPLAVSTSRDPILSYDVGTWFDRRYPIMFVLDRFALATRHKIVPHADVDDTGNIWGAGVGHTRGTESEERVIGSIFPLSRYLLSINIKLSDLIEAKNDKEWFDSIVEEGELRSLEEAHFLLTKFEEHPKLNKVKLPGLRF